jgi:NitT/TauT family transport system substrate-binding protein
VVRGFVRAALRGWKYTLDNPEEAAQIQVQFNKALDPQIIVEEIRILKRLAVVPDTQAGGFGAMNRDKMRRTVDFINSNVDVQGTKLSADDIMREGFLPKEPIKP